MDQRLLEQATAARDRWEELQRQSAGAKVRFHQAVLSLHESGATLREIAAALHLSHQRVHQIVVGDGLWARIGLGLKLSTRRAARCSFCGVGFFAARRLIAGPGVWICDQCVGVAERVLREGAPQTGQAGLSATTSGKTRCSFCGKQRRAVKGVAAAGDVAICDRCLAICGEVLAGAGQS